MPEFLPILLAYCAMYVGLLLATRSVLRRRLSRHMRSGATAAEAAPVRAVPPARALSIEVINAAWSSDDGDAHQRFVRETRSHFRRSALLDLALVATYVALMALGLRVATRWFDVLVPVLLVVSVRYLFHRRRYWVGGSPPWRPRLLWGLGVLPPLLVGLWLLHRLSSPVLQAPIRWGLLLGLAGWGIAQLHEGQGWGWLCLAAALALALADAAGWRRLQGGRGQRLLMLRVFHKDGWGTYAGVATFHAVLDRWLNFGPFFTVMDAELQRLRSPVFSVRTGALFIGLFFYFAHYADNLLKIQAIDHVLPVAVALLAWLVESWLAYRRTLAVMVTDRADIPRVVAAGERPRGLDLRYRSVEVSCTDATWYPTVVAIAAHAEVVLMDLRGYTPERAGCDTEVNLLFDAVNLRRIVFMIEPGELAQIQALFARCWHELAVDSPNLDLAHPVVAVLEYPLEVELGSDRLAERQVLLEELLIRATGPGPGRLERAKRSPRHVAVLPETGSVANVSPAAPVAAGVSVPTPLASAMPWPVASPQHSAAPLASAAPLPSASPLVDTPIGLSPVARRAIRTVIAQFNGTRGFLVGPRISERKLRHARQRAGIPPQEPVLALIDKTPFGSAKDCMVFTDTALRYHYSGQRHVVDYMYLPSRRLKARGLQYLEVLAPDGTAMQLDTLQGDAAREDVLTLLHAISAAVASWPTQGLLADPPGTDAGAVPELGPQAMRAVHQALQGAIGLRSTFVGDSAPANKARNARAACAVPPEEPLIVLIDLSVFGSAETCWTFSNRALRYRGSKYDSWVFEYRYFANLRFSSKGSGTVIVQAADGFVSQLGCYTPGPKACVALLEAIRAAVQLEREASQRAAAPPRGA